MVVERQIEHMNYEIIPFPQLFTILALLLLYNLIALCVINIFQKYLSWLCISSVLQTHIAKAKTFGLLDSNYHSA